jgi:hypothetical protein
MGVELLKISLCEVIRCMQSKVFLRPVRKIISLPCHKWEQSIIFQEWARFRYAEGEFRYVSWCPVCLSYWNSKWVISLKCKLGTSSIKRDKHLHFPYTKTWFIISSPFVTTNSSNLTRLCCRNSVVIWETKLLPVKSEWCTINLHTSLYVLQWTLVVITTDPNIGIILTLQFGKNT